MRGTSWSRHVLTASYANHMKTITLRIGNMVNGPSPAYPVELEVDQQVTRAAIPADEVDVKRQALVQDPGVWGGRELGGEDPDGNGPRRTTNSPDGSTSSSSAAIWPRAGGS